MLLEDATDKDCLLRCRTREFRYDGARQRYMIRVLDPDALEGDSIQALSTTWSDYDGDEIYGDYRVISGDAVELRTFEPGLGRVDPWTDSGSLSTMYYHTNHLGTTRLMTDSATNEVDPVVYTAFGEKISGPNHRYGYAGSWGYRGPSSDDPGDAYLDFPFLHVGHRYYDPATGRFLQRDPIGIMGGLNTYEYVRNSPTVWVDPVGAYPFDGFPNMPGKPKPPKPKPKPKPQKPLTPAQELERIKKDITVKTACGNLFSIVALPIAILIDEFTHWDEPANPLWGGSYENW